MSNNYIHQCEAEWEGFIHYTLNKKHATTFWAHCIYAASRTKSLGWMVLP